MPGQTRDARRTDAPDTTWTPSGKSYIVAIGITEYANFDRLPNAVNDARKITEVLTHCDFSEPPGVSSLFDGDATYDALNSLIRDQLPVAVTPEDSLVLFYAGHGETTVSTVWDPEKPGQKKTVQTGYLLPADAKRDRPSTWFDLSSFLDVVAKLPALHVLVILDACKSGFALADKFTFRGDMGGALTDLAQRPSRRVMTSAMHDQRALDGGGFANSLFTDILAGAIENMDADLDGDGFVTSRQLFDFVQPRVGDKARQVFSLNQTPDYGALGGDGSGDLILSLQGDRFKLKQAGESLAAADAVYRLGQWTGDRKRFDFAARLYKEARDLFILGRAASAEAEFGLAKALLATGKVDEASKTLAALLDAAGDAAPAESGLWLGVALAKQGQHKQAAETLTGWRAGPDDGRAAWATAYAKWLRGAAEGDDSANTRDTTSGDHFSPQFAAAEYGDRREADLVQFATSWLESQAILYPSLPGALGLQLLNQEEVEPAIVALKRAIALDANAAPAVRFALCRASLIATQYDEAYATWQQITSLSSAERDALDTAIQRLVGIRTRALIVDASVQESGMIGWVYNQARSSNIADIVRLLSARWRFSPDDIVVLTGSNARADLIQGEFARLTQSPIGTPVFFYYRDNGRGSGAPGGGDHWVDRLPTTLSLDQLLGMGPGGRIDLLAVIHLLLPSPGALPKDEGSAAPSPEGQKRIEYMLASGAWIFAQTAADTGATTVSVEAIRRGGVTRTLLDALTTRDPTHFTRSQLGRFLSEHSTSPAVSLIRENMGDWILFRPAAYSRALALLVELERRPVREAAQELDRMIASREARDDPWPEGRLNAGIAYALAGDLDAARRRLEEAAAVLEGRGIGREAAQMAA